MALSSLINGQMDFVGQQQAERLYQLLIVVPTVIGFIHGYLTKDFHNTFYWWAAGASIAGLLTLPVWPMWARHPVKWADELEDESGNQKAQGKSAKR